MLRASSLVLSLVFLIACGSDDSNGSGGTHASGGSSHTGGSGGKGGSSSGGAGTGAGQNGGSGGTSGTGATGATGGTSGTGGTPSLACPALAPASGTIVNVTPADLGNLPSTLLGAAEGTTFVFADGTYNLSTTLQLAKNGLTLRSASDDASKVVLDGTYTVDELVAVSASDVTIAHITLTHAVHHAIHVYPPGPGVDVKGLHVYAASLIDNGQQFIKVNPIAGQLGYIDEGVVECSNFQMTDAGRPHIESCCGGCYTGGIDAHEAWKWVVRNNRFEGIYCDGAGLAEHAVHFWKGSRDTLVENNLIVNCARGIGFGLGGGAGERVYPDNPYNDPTLAHYDGVIRNNVVWDDIPWFDTGIELDETKEPHVFFNTVLHGSGATNAFSSIDYRFAMTSVVIQNNLTTKLTVRDGATGTVDHNLEATPAADFVNLGTDFHLTPGASDAIDQGVSVSQGGVDIDGQTHDVGAPDLGADEVQK